MMLSWNPLEQGHQNSSHPTHPAHFLSSPSESIHQGHLLEAEEGQVWSSPTGSDRPPSVFFLELDSPPPPGPFADGVHRSADSFDPAPSVWSSDLALVTEQAGVGRDRPSENSLTAEWERDLLSSDSAFPKKIQSSSLGLGLGLGLGPGPGPGPASTPHPTWWSSPPTPPSPPPSSLTNSLSLCGGHNSLSMDHFDSFRPNLMALSATNSSSFKTPLLDQQPPLTISPSLIDPTYQLHPSTSSIHHHHSHHHFETAKIQTQPFSILSSTSDSPIVYSVDPEPILVFPTPDHSPSTSSSFSNQQCLDPQLIFNNQSASQIDLDNWIDFDQPHSSVMVTVQSSEPPEEQSPRTRQYHSTSISSLSSSCSSSSSASSLSSLAPPIQNHEQPKWKSQPKQPKQSKGKTRKPKEFLERNRLAAFRSRQKKKILETELEAKLSELESESNRLKSTLESLVMEKTHLVQMLQEHQQQHHPNDS